MDKETIKEFFTDRSKLDPEKYLILDYFFETSIDPDEAAANLCREQSTAQWKRAGVDEDLRVNFGAKVIGLEVERVLEGPSYPMFAACSDRAYHCRAKIAHPHVNFGSKLPNLLTAVCGEGAFFSPGINNLKLFDIEFPEGYLATFDGPKFGIDGIREMLGVYDRPVFFGVVKPNVGLAPGPFAELAFESWVGGLDIAKDDEMLGDTDWSPLGLRSEAVFRARLEAERITGKKKMYLANITDEVDRVTLLHDIAVKNGANAVMINGMTTGLSVVRMLRRHTKVPLVGHFDFIAPFARMPYFGIHSKLFTKLQRIVGFDAIVMPGFGDRMKTPEYEVKLNVDECFKGLGHMKRSLPVPGGGDWAGTLESVYKKIGTADFGFVPGRGVFGHPLGPRAGAVSLHQAWDAIQKGMALEEYAADHPELKAAIGEFG